MVDRLPIPGSCTEVRRHAREAHCLIPTLDDIAVYFHFYLASNVLHGASPPLSYRYLLHGLVRVHSNDIFFLQFFGMYLVCSKSETVCEGSCVCSLRLVP